MRRGLLPLAVVFVIVATGAPTARAEDVQDPCVPSCRAGYLCHQGTCISACNPACADGEVCGADGECHGTGVATRPNTPGDPGWAPGAGKAGIVVAVIIGGLTAGIVISDDSDVGIPLGIVATAIGGISIPIVASGGGSARRSGGVEGNPGLRRTAWIVYATSLADAVLLLGLALSDVDVPAPLAGSVGVLGATSAVMFSLDAFASARQARATLATRPTGWRPQLAVTRDLDGGMVPTVGLALGF